MSAAWITILALTVTTAAIRASGPLLMGDRDLHPRAAGVVDLLAPALLTALIAVALFGGDQRLEASAAVFGVAAAGLVLWKRPAALLPALAVAAAVTALARML